MDESASPLRPVAALGDQPLRIGGALAPAFANRPWREADAALRTAVLILHGRQRNADTYLAVGVEAAAGADCLLIAPQFPARADLAAHGAPADTLYWHETGWMGGDAALGPAPVSAFAVLDAIVAHLADRARFPALAHIVVAGHSGGGQVVQRYAILTDSPAPLRFVVANPSSYAYFTPERPAGDGFAVPDEADFPGFDTWKYGMKNRPAYGAGPSGAALAARYAGRNVTYLLGTEDRDPAHSALDTAPPAMAQGPHRLARGRAWWRYLQARSGAALNQRMIEIEGAAHEPRAMFAHPRARAVLFPATTTNEETP